MTRVSPAYRKPHTDWQRRAALDGGVAYGGPARATRPRIRIRKARVAGLLVVIVAMAVTLDHQFAASPISTSTSPIDGIRSEIRGLRSGHSDFRDQHDAALGEAGGAIPSGTTVFDDEVPGVAKLDPALLSAVRQAATDAANNGVEFFVDSGWRSPQYQEALLREAISKYGSAQEASRWVATPRTSSHVSGHAIDIGHSDAAAWLSAHGAAYGLCRIYGNEPWHFELRPEARDRGCPAMYADPTHDPRMQR
jgi:hypothetical protein